MKPIACLISLFLLIALVGCDSQHSGEMQPNTFSARVVDGPTSRTVSGTAVKAEISLATKFRRLVRYDHDPLESDPVRVYRVIELIAKSGEQILVAVGRAGRKDGGLGRYEIFGSPTTGLALGIYTDEDGLWKVSSGAVEISAEGESLQGDIEVVLDRSDAARPMRFIGSFHAVNGEVAQLSNDRECREGLWRRFEEWIKSGQISREDAAARVEAALEAGICREDGHRDRDDSGDDDRRRRDHGGGGVR